MYMALRIFLESINPAVAHSIAELLLLPVQNVLQRQILVTFSFISSTHTLEKQMDGEITLEPINSNKT